MAQSSALVEVAGVEEDDAEDHEQAWKDGIYNEKHTRPDYYQEAPTALRIFKAVIMAAIAIGPYYVVLDQIGLVKPDQFVPCSNHSCTYMRMWHAGKSLPGTGADFIRVKNGMKRPLSMSIPSMTVYSVDEEGKRHTQRKNPPGDNTTEEKLQEQQDWVNEKFSHLSMVALVVTKTPLNILMLPVKFASWVLGAQTGMQHVASGQCPGETDMSAHCRKPDITKEIINHLSKGTSLVLFKVGIFLWFTLTITHDIMLLSGRFNVKVIWPLLVGAAATVAQGVACASLFLWAMGATEVFAAPAGEGCMCYYELPPLQALLALSTPFALLFNWAARIQLLALSALYGDYLYNAKFIVPHHLAKKTMLWTWSLMLSPKVAGTTQDKGNNWYQRICNVNPKNFDRLYLMMFGMYLLRWAVLIIVSIAAAPFMVRVRELITVLASETEGSVQNLLRFVAQPLPAVLAVVMGLWSLYSWKVNIVGKDHLRLFLDREDPTPQPVRWALYAFVAVLITVLSIACLEGLWPSWSAMLEPKSAERPSLALAELWGCCGFGLCILTIEQITREIFCLEEEMNMLRKVGDADGENKGATSFLGRCFA